MDRMGLVLYGDGVGRIFGGVDVGDKGKWRNEDDLGFLFLYLGRW